MAIIEKIIFKLLGGKKIEERLMKCQSYKSGSIPKWKSQTNLNWRTTIKFLQGLEIFDSPRLRGIIRNIVVDNKEIFNRNNLFITAFGKQGKSGGHIVYEFKHSQLASSKKYIHGWEVAKLPENSTILFVDDLIGTGSQSTEFILEELNPFLNPSYNPYLLTICATLEGMDKIENDTNFRVITGIVLTEEHHQHYSEKCNYFTLAEKEKLRELNACLKNPLKEDYDKGLLVSFYYSPPNNSMPIIWKDNYPYKNRNGEEKKWFALIPREY